MPRRIDHTLTKTATGDGRPARQAVPPVLVWVFPTTGFVTYPTVSAQRLGRGDDCDTCLRGKTISWHHAELRLVGGLLQLTDLGSRNGTRVNGRTLTEPTTLELGDVVRCGEWLGCVAHGTPQPYTFGPIAPGLWGGSGLARVLEPARKLAVRGFPMVLEGPTGAGKERVATAIHGWSGRRGEFVGVNCAAIPAELAESELFGHTKGAFSGADRSRSGYLRQADGGTLLLDEFVELALPLQAKLLRALQESEVRPVGGTSAQKIDVLILAAAQHPLEEMVDRGLLREDLAARLSDLTIRLPALADRREDIAPLFLHFLTQEAQGSPPQVDTGLVEWLMLHPFRHNVRGLERLARTMVALHGHEPLLEIEHVPESYRGRSAPEQTAAPRERELLFQRIVQALEEHHGNISRAAAALGLDRSKVRRVLKEHPEFDVNATRHK